MDVITCTDDCAFEIAFGIPKETMGRLDKQLREKIYARTKSKLAAAMKVEMQQAMLKEAALKQEKDALKQEIVDFQIKKEKQGLLKQSVKVNEIVDNALKDEQKKQDDAFAEKRRQRAERMRLKRLKEAALPKAEKGSQQEEVNNLVGNLWDREAQYQTQIKEGFDKQNEKLQQKLAARKKKKNRVRTKNRLS